MWDSKESHQVFSSFSIKAVFYINVWVMQRRVIILIYTPLISSCLKITLLIGSGGEIRSYGKARAQIIKW